MRVGIDISAMHSFSKSRGIGSYAFNLVDSLNKYTDIEALLIEGVKSRKSVDLIHYPFFDFFNLTLPLIKSKPTVVTVHDIIPIIFPEHYPPGQKGEIKKRIQLLSLKGARAIVTDSSSSRKDIVQFLGLNQEKIFNIPLAPGPGFKVIPPSSLGKIKEKFSLPDKFCLFIGSVNWNKNIVSMVNSCIKNKIEIVLVGGDFENKGNLDHPELKTYKEFIEKFSSDRMVKILGRIENQELVSIINLASATLLPSFYEGFGLPILESQACGTPVITSRTSSMPEVAGDGAFFVDPYSEEEMSFAVKRVMEDRALRDTLVERGLKNSKKYSWEKTALNTANVYKGILNVKS